MTSNKQIKVFSNKTVDTSKLELTKFITNKNQETSYKPSYVNYKITPTSSSPFRYQLKNTKLVIPITFSEMYKTYGLLLPLTETDYETMLEIEEKIIELGLPMCQELIDMAPQKGAKKARKVLSSADFTSILRAPNQEKGYAPSLSLKFKFNEDTQTFYTPLIDKQAKPLTFTVDNFDEHLTRGSTVDCILSCVLYKLSDKFGVTWKPVKFRVVEKGSSSENIDFDDSEAEQEEEQQQEDADFESVSESETDEIEKILNK